MFAQVFALICCLVKSETDFSLSVDFGQSELTDFAECSVFWADTDVQSEDIKLAWYFEPI